MKILFATAEAGPYIRTGGLGDVAQALPLALTSKGQDTRVVLPLYGDVIEKYGKSLEFVGSVIVPLGWRQQYAGLFTDTINGVKYYFVDNEYYFNRKGLYGFFDDGERFAFFSKAILELMPLMGFYPDMLHCNDWQTGLVPVMLDCYYREIEEYKNIRTVVAIHNIEFQGNMDIFVIEDVFGIPSSHRKVVEYKNNANMLKAGIERANKVVTVSPTYANEILSPFFSYGLEDILYARKYKLSGIVNGIDTDMYNPKTDKALFKNFTIKSRKNKAANRAGLQKMMGLPVADKPLIGMVTRLTAQKGIDLLLHVFDEIMRNDIQMVILGTGDWKYENALKELAAKYPDKLAISINFSQDIANKIYGSSDMFLMPSKFEPCGLSQMIAMRYGSVPIVRETGGLKDTVEAFNPTSMTGVGFTFKSYDAYDMLDAINRAVGTFYNKVEWDRVMSNAMAVDSSWNVSADAYIALYDSIQKSK